jgi:hypothetical protein
VSTNAHAPIAARRNVARRAAVGAVTVVALGLAGTSGAAAAAAGPGASGTGAPGPSGAGDLRAVGAAAPRSRTAVSVAYGVTAARTLDVAVRLTRTQRGTRVVLESRSPSGRPVVRTSRRVQAGRARLRWRVPRSLASVSVRVRVVSGAPRRRTLTRTSWRTLQISGIGPTAPVADVAAPDVRSAPVPGQPGPVQLAGASDVRVGQVLALGIGDATPLGLLARVVAVTQTPSGTLAQTVPATLPEVVPSGAVDITLPTEPARSLRAAPVGREVACAGGTKLQAKGSASVSAGVRLHVGWRFPLRINARFEGSVRAQAALAASVTGQASCTLPKTALLTRPLRLGTYTFSIGPVPVVVVAQAQLYLAASASVQAAVTTTATASLTATAGVHYTDGAFGPIGTLTPTITHQAPKLTASGNAQLAISPTLDVLIDGIAGPRIDLVAGLKLDADIARTPWWVLSAPMSLGAQLRLDIWKAQLASDRLVVFSAEPRLADANTPTAPPPPPPGPPPPPAPPAPRTIACGDRFFRPSGGGFALLVNDLRARRVSCARALTIAGTHTLGAALPAGWRCRAAGAARSVCTRRRAYVSYVFGGDAG